ncbi:MAG TPA: acyl-CoA dehydrogenase [Sphingomonas sp.]|nr:acyl-CoA dehydrogenase [Sphingomonas sp.]
MNFDLDDEQVMLRDMVARFMAERSSPADRTSVRLTPAGFSGDNWRAMGELGLLGLPFAAEQGGMGGGPIELMVVMEQLGRGLAAEPYLFDLILAGRLLDRAGSESQREAWLPGIISGERRLALAHGERAARYNPLFVQCRATRHKGGATLDGVKTFVLAGSGADAFLVSAREHGGPDQPEGLSLYLVRADAAGLDRRDYRLVDGSAACELHLRDVPGEPLEGGADALLAAFDEARVAACAEMIGIMALLFETTLDHLRTRKQFGQPIGSFQAVQHRMADLYAALEQSRSHLYRAALVADEDAPTAIAGAKSFISAAAVRLGEECIQFHGGMGTSDELIIGRGHKRILLLATLLGDSESELGRYVGLMK